MPLNIFESKYTVLTVPVKGELTGAIASGTPTLLVSGVADQHLIFGLVELTGLDSPCNTKLYSYNGATYSVVKEYLRASGIISDDCDISLPLGSGLYVATDYVGVFSYYLRKATTN